jgi:hypothetical protein
MRFRTALSLATLFLICFTVAAWSTTPQPLPDNQSVAGKISSVGDAAFSVQVTKNQQVSTVEFLVDGDTKVEGKLAIGAQVAVEYRSDSGKNVAVHVVVTPSSGMRLR